MKHDALRTPADVARRKQAEGTVADNGAVPRTVPSPEETGRLLEELRVHQIELEMQNEELRRAQQDYQTLFREMPDGFALHEIVCNASGEPVDYRFLAINPAFERMTGLKAEEVLGKTVLEALPGAERHWIETYGKVALTGESVVFENYSSALDKHFAVTAFRPAPNQFVCIVADITTRKRAEEDRQRLEGQLRNAQKMEAVGRLAGGVAHDFNNMLMGIMGYAELCRDEVGPEHPTREWLNEITRGAERSANLTRQLLAFARRQMIAPKVVDLNDAIEGMLKMLRLLIGEDKDLAWRPGATLWSVKIDPGQIDQILANLCLNARDAIGGVGRITIATENATIDDAYCAEHAEAAPGDYVMLAVSDTGCGMDAETLEHIFEPFFTTKGVGEGTGLGLATVYGIVKQNQGFVAVRSAPGKGATFTIYLPRHMAIPSPLTGKASDRPAERGHETILLVEDEPALLELTTLMLERLGYAVMAAVTPDEAMRLAEEHAGEIHVLISDMVMPGMSGWDLAASLSVLRPHMKCLFISGYTEDIIARCGVLGEGVHFLAKPFGRDDLARKVRQVLRSEQVISSL